MTEILSKECSSHMRLPWGQRCGLLREGAPGLILTVCHGGESVPRIDFSALSPQERLELVGDPLDSLEDSDIPLSEGMRAELDRRNAAFPETRKHAAPWAEVRARLRPNDR